MKLSDFLVVTDIDGTLMIVSEGIPQRNVEAIDKFIKRGGKFTLCTGRGVEGASHMLELVRISAPAIMCNGGICYDYASKEIRFQTTLDDDARYIVEDLTREFPSCGVELVVPDRVMIPRMNRHVMNHVTNGNMAYELCELDDAERNWNKILFAEDPDVIDRMIAYIDEKSLTDELYAKYSYVRTSPIFYECIPKGINKGDSMLRLAGLLNVKPENTIAIGDYYNDLPLLEKAGTSVVVAGAPDDIKERADIVVCGCMDGGVGEYLEMLMEKYPE